MSHYKPLLITLGTATVGGFVETKYGSCSYVSAHGPQLSAVTPAILSARASGPSPTASRRLTLSLLASTSSQDVDERFAYPNLYAQGTSKHVRAFNCVQRSHQQIYETFTTAVVSGLAASLTFPLCSAASTLTYAVGRYYLSKGYAEAAEEGGDASKRYKYPLAKYMWFGYLGNIALGMASCVMIVSGKKALK
ncbi:hypothetical protein ACHAXT_012158 [Thalassiosira profunda]